MQTALFPSCDHARDAGRAVFGIAIGEGLAAPLVASTSEPSSRRSVRSSGHESGRRMRSVWMTPSSSSGFQPGRRRSALVPRSRSQTCGTLSSRSPGRYGPENRVVPSPSSAQRTNATVVPSGERWGREPSVRSTHPAGSGGPGGASGVGAAAAGAAGAGSVGHSAGTASWQQTALLHPAEPIATATAATAATTRDRRGPARIGRTREA